MSLDAIVCFICFMYFRKCVTRHKNKQEKGSVCLPRNIKIISVYASCEDVIITNEVHVVNMKILSAVFCQTCVIVEA